VSDPAAAEQFHLPEPRDTEVDATEFAGPLEWYWHFSQRGDFQTDSDQLKVLDKLQALFEQLEDYRQYRAGKLNRLVTNLGAGRKPPRGMYIWGGVGRGKSLMMDAFFKVSRHRRKRRVHFHEFMREIHARMRELSGSGDPILLSSVDMYFHRAVARHSGNVLAAQIWEGLAQHIFIVFCRHWSSAADRTGEVRLHEGLVEFVRTGSPGGIDDVLSKHFSEPSTRAAAVVPAPARRASKKRSVA